MKRIYSAVLIPISTILLAIATITAGIGAPAQAASTFDTSFPSNYPSGVSFTWIDDLQITDSLGNNYYWGSGAFAYIVKMPSQGTYGWCNGSNMQNITSSLTFVPNSSDPTIGGGAIPSNINEAQSGRLITDIPSSKFQGANCKPDILKNVSIGSPQNALINWHYANKDTQIVSYQQDGFLNINAGSVYKSGTQSGIGAAFIQENGGSCPGYIVIDPSSNGQRGVAYKGGCSNTGQGRSGPHENIYLQSPTASITGASGAAADPTSASSDPNATGGGSGSGGPTCGDTSGFSWIICPAITGISSLTVSLYTNYIEPLLAVRALSTAPTDPLYQIWQTFRSLADVFFVVIFLVIIFSTAVSTGIDSYTIKKMLPRLVVAAILVQFSYFLCGVVVDIGNILGSGVLTLIQHTIASANVPNQSGSAASPVLSGLTVFAPAAGIAAIAAGPAAPAILMALVGLLIGIVVFVVTLSIRQLLINVLIVLSPIAFVLWIMPNTSKLFDKWKDNFIKVILMFPFISLLFGAGLIVSAVAQSNNGGSNGGVGTILGMLGPIIAFCMMPMAFKMAGTAMSGVTGAVGRRGKAINDRAQNSQFAKDMKANSKGKQALKYQDAKGLRKVMRGAAIGGVGGMLGTAGSKRRIAALASKHENDQGDQFEEQMKRVNNGTGMTKDDYTELLSAKDGATTKAGIKVNEASRKKAIQMAAKSGNWEALRDVKNSIPESEYSGSKMEAAFKQGLAGTDAYTKAPDLLRTPGIDGLRPQTADAFAAMHHTTKKAVVDQMQKDLTSEDKVVRDKAGATLNAITQALDKNPGAIDTATQKSIFDFASHPDTTGLSVAMTEKVVDPVTGVESTVSSSAPALSAAQADAIKDRFDGAGNLKQGQAVRVLP